MIYGVNTASAVGTTRKPKRKNGGSLVGQVTGTQFGAGALTPAGPAPTPQPIDPQFVAYQAQQGLQAGVADANATYQRGQTAYQTGYNQDGSLNTANPYSQAALLQESYNRNVRGTTNGYANAGQLYSGALGRMQNENARNYSIGSNNLQNQAQGIYHGIDVGQAQSDINGSFGTTNAGLTALLKALGVTA